jgi:hypothetical protein
MWTKKKILLLLWHFWFSDRLYRLRRVSFFFFFFLSPSQEDSEMMELLWRKSVFGD